MPFGSFIGGVIGKQMINSPKTHASLTAMAQSARAQALASVATNAVPVTGIGAGSYASWATGAATSSVATFARDPLEYATEVALSQPADKEWRRFQHALFRKADVIAISAEGSGSVCIQLRLEAATRQEVFTLPFKCDDPVQWFAEHVLGFEFPNAKHAT